MHYHLTGQVSLKQLLGTLLHADGLFRSLETVSAAGGRRGHWPAVESTTLDCGHKPVIAFLPDIRAMCALHGPDLVEIAHVPFLSLENPLSAAQRAPAKERLCAAAHHAPMRQHEEIGLPTAPDAPRHLKHDFTVARMRLALMNFHASGARPQTAALIAIKEPLSSAGTGTVLSLWTKIRADLSFFLKPCNLGDRRLFRKQSRQCDYYGLDGLRAPVVAVRHDIFSLCAGFHFFMSR
jgi:hypothetical protein